MHVSGRVGDVSREEADFGGVFGKGAEGEDERVGEVGFCGGEGGGGEGEEAEGEEGEDGDVHCGRGGGSSDAVVKAGKGVGNRYMRGMRSDLLRRSGEREKEELLFSLHEYVVLCDDTGYIYELVEGCEVVSQSVKVSWAAWAVMICFGWIAGIQQTSLQTIAWRVGTLGGRETKTCSHVPNSDAG